MNTEQEKFHNHLDSCQQCADAPFELCPLGAVLLQAAGAVPFVGGVV